MTVDGAPSAFSNRACCCRCGDRRQLDLAGGSRTPGRADCSERGSAGRGPAVSVPSARPLNAVGSADAESTFSSEAFSEMHADLLLLL